MAFELGFNRLVKEVEETVSLLCAGGDGGPHSLVIALARYAASALKDILHPCFDGRVTAMGPRLKPADHRQHAWVEDWLIPEFGHMGQEDLAMAVYVLTQLMFGNVDWQVEQFDVLDDLKLTDLISKGSQRVRQGPDGAEWGNGAWLFVTCLSTFMLEVYYRHLPIYKADILSGGL